MKFKFFSTLLVIGLIFTSCEKEEAKIQGCTDPLALNFNVNADEDNGSCNYLWTCDVVYYLDYSASLYMIANNIPYYSFYDGSGNLLGSISNQYYWNIAPSCIFQGDGSTVTSPLEWTGGEYTTTATLSWSAYAPGDILPTYSGDHIVTAGLCNQIGLTLKKIESYQDAH